MVVNLAVTNDAAERGVKLCADFKDSAINEASLQTVLQTVENERAELPNIRNRNQEPTSWFLAIDKEDNLRFNMLLSIYCITSGRPRISAV